MAASDGENRGPREVADPNNVQYKRSASGTVKADVGNSQFYSKFGILPIYDSTDSLEKAQGGATVKIKKMTRIYDGSTKFPKLEECAHFHYDFVEFGGIIRVSICEDNQENICRQVGSDGEHYFFLKVQSNEKQWLVRRTYENFRMFDKQLHKCIYDRKYSQLPELRKNEVKDENIPALKKLLALYLNRFSSITGNMINCGPILSWMEMDNRGNRLIVTDDSAINTPAVAAAHVVKRYNAQAADEISFEVGDIISIIDMPPPEETTWWRGKRGFEVGFFPAGCVEVIGDTVPQAMASKIPETPQKPVLRRRGKLISFLRMFFSTRPARTQLKRTGIMKERIFGCDLGEHLLNSGQDVPLVLKCCAEVIETHGIVDGIYRLSGVASNIQKLRQEFDEEQLPDLASEEYLQDIHSISSLLKMYFRELPNPLLTYQLYDKFSAAVQDEDSRLTKIHDVIQQLPPPHYRTAEYLIRHLARVAAHGSKTGMHCKNLAIVWAPNLLRSKELEMSCNAAALQGVGLQAIVTEFLIMYADLIFSDKLPSFNNPGEPATPRKARPKSLAISTPTKLLSLEEARERALNVTSHSPKQKYIDVGGGPANLPPKYHTVLDVPHKKKLRKDRKSPAMSGWRSLFTRNRAHSWKTDKELCDEGHQLEVAPIRLSSKTEKALTEEDVAKRRKLRTVKSADSLLSATSSILGQRLSDMSDSHTIANPYAEDDESKSGPPSLCSTITYAGPSTDTQRPLLPVRSMSYDHSAMQPELDMDFEDISPTEDVFVASSGHHHLKESGAMPKKVKKKHVSSERMYKKGVLSELENRFHNRSSDSDSMTSESHASLTQSYPPSGQAPVYVVSRSESMGSYEVGIMKSSPGSKGFSKSGSLDPPQSPPIPPRRVHRSRSMGHDPPSRKHSVPRSKTSLSPTVSPTAEVAMETDVYLSPNQQNQRSPRQARSQRSQGHESATSPSRSPSLKERIVLALSPRTARRKNQAGENSGQKTIDDDSEPPLPLPRRSKSKEKNPYHDQTEDLICNKSFLDKEDSPGFDLSGQSGDSAESPQVLSSFSSQRNSSHSSEMGTSPHYSEAYGHLRPRLRADKQLSPLGEMLPVELAESPGSKRKIVSLSHEYADLEEQGMEGAHCKMASADNLAEADSILRNAKVHIHTDSEESDVEKARLPIRSNFHKDVHFISPSQQKLVETDMDLGEANNDQPELLDSEKSNYNEIDYVSSLKSGECPNPSPLPAGRMSGIIPVTPENEQYLSELKDAEKMLETMGSPTNRMSKTLSVPSELQKSLDDLGTPADMGSIGSFTELSMSLDSLLNDIGSRSLTTPQSEKVVDFPPKVAQPVATCTVPPTMESESDRQTSSGTCSSEVRYTSTSSVDSDIHPAEVYAESLSPTPRAERLPSSSSLAGDSSESEIRQFSVGSCKTPTNIESEVSTLFDARQDSDVIKRNSSLADAEDFDTDLDDNNTDVVLLWDIDNNEAKETDVDAIPFDQQKEVAFASNASMTTVSSEDIEIEDVTGSSIDPVNPVSLAAKDNAVLPQNDQSAGVTPCMASGEPQVQPQDLCLGEREATPIQPISEAQAGRIVIRKPLETCEPTTVEAKPVTTPTRQVACGVTTPVPCPRMPSLELTVDEHATVEDAVSEETDIDAISDPSSPTSASGSTAILKASQESIVTMTTDEDPMSMSRSSLDDLNSSKDSLDMDLQTASDSNQSFEVVDDPHTAPSSTHSFEALDTVSMATSPDSKDINNKVRGANSSPEATMEIISTALKDSLTSSTSSNLQDDVFATDSQHVPSQPKTESRNSQACGKNEDSPDPAAFVVRPAECTRSPVRAERKASVKELLSKFETDGSPPKDSPEKPQEVKFKPLVYHKPKIIHVTSLSPTSKDSGFDFLEASFQDKDSLECERCSVDESSGLAASKERTTSPLSVQNLSTSPSITDRWKHFEKADVALVQNESLSEGEGVSSCNKPESHATDTESAKSETKVDVVIIDQDEVQKGNNIKPRKMEYESLSVRKQRWERQISEPDSRNSSWKGDRVLGGSLDRKKLWEKHTLVPKEECDTSLDNQRQVRASSEKRYICDNQDQKPLEVVDLNVNIEQRGKSKDRGCSFSKHEIIKVWEKEDSPVGGKIEHSDEIKYSTNSLEKRKFWESKAIQPKDKKMAKNLENTQEKVERSESFRECKQLWERRTPEPADSNKDKKSNDLFRKESSDNVKDRKRLWETTNSSSSNGQKGKVVEVENKAKMVGNREVRLESSSESLDHDLVENVVDQSSRTRSISSGEQSLEGNDSEESERSVRSLSQMFERHSGSRGPSAEPEAEDGATGGASRSSPRQRDSHSPHSSSKTSKAWTTIL